jgi:hypothetical protein
MKTISRICVYIVWAELFLIAFIWLGRAGSIELQDLQDFKEIEQNYVK